MFSPIETPPEATSGPSRVAYPAGRGGKRQPPWETCRESSRAYRARRARERIGGYLSSHVTSDAAASEPGDQPLPHTLDLCRLDRMSVVVGRGDEQFKPILCRPLCVASCSTHRYLLVGWRAVSLAG